MKIQEVITFLEKKAHPSLQEKYDNCGLLTGDHSRECSGILCSLDATEEVILDAVAKKCNLVVAHHPIIFGGLKKLNGSNYVERSVIAAIKNDIAIYAIHTSLDNIASGVNGRIAGVLGLKDTRILLSKDEILRKLFVFVPKDHADAVRNAVFTAGGGHISNYSECSFNSEGEGTFKAGAGANPFVGKTGKRHTEREIRIEIIYPAFAEREIIESMKKNHPYEEVAFDIVPLANPHPGIGSGLLGSLPKPLPGKEFLDKIRSVFGVPMVRHTRLPNKPVEQVAICGGAGSFLISKALSAGADAFVTADIKYHEFFDGNDNLLLCDVGHYESERFTIDLIQEELQQKFPTFAVLKTGVITNPVNYF